MSPVSSTSADHSDADSVDYSSYQFAGPQIPTPEYQLDDTIEPSIEYMLPNERRAINAQYERERREEMVNAYADLADAVGASRTITKAELLATSITRLQRASEVKHSSDLDSLRRCNKNLGAQIEMLERRLTEAGEIDTAGRLPQELTDTSRPVKRKRDDSETKVGVPVPKRSPQEYEQPLDRTLKGDNNAEDQAPNCSVKPDLQPINPLFPRSAAPIQPVLPIPTTEGSVFDHLEPDADYSSFALPPVLDPGCEMGTAGYIRHVPPYTEQVYYHLAPGQQCPAGPLPSTSSFKQHQDSFGDVTKHSLDHAFLPVDPWLPVAATSHQDLPASRMSPVSSTSADHSDADSVDYSSYQFAGPQIPTPEYQLDDTIEPSIEYMLPNERRAINAQYERERREEMVNAYADLADAVGASRTITKAELLATSITRLQRASEVKHSSDLDSLRRCNKNLGAQIEMLERRLTEAGEIDTAGRLPQELTDTSRPVKRKRDDSETKVGVPVPKRSPQEYEQPLDRTLKGDNNAEDQAPNCSVKPDLQPINPLFPRSAAPIQPVLPIPTTEGSVFDHLEPDADYSSFALPPVLDPGCEMGTAGYIRHVPPYTEQVYYHLAPGQQCPAGPLPSTSSFKQHQDSFGDVTKHSLDHAFLPVDPWLPVAATSHQDLPASRMSPVSSTSADHSDADSVDYSSYQFAGPQIPTPEYQLDDTIEPSIEYMLPNERRAINAQYERERREEMVNAYADLADAVGASRTITKAELLATSITRLQRASEVKHSSDLDSLRRCNKNLGAQIEMLERRLTEAGEIDTAGRLPQELTDTSRPVKRKRDDSETKVGVPVPKRSPQEYEQPLDRTLKGDNNAEDQAPNCSVKPDLQPINPLFPRSAAPIQPVLPIPTTEGSVFDHLEPDADYSSFALPPVLDPGCEMGTAGYIRHVPPYTEQVYYHLAPGQQCPAGPLPSTSSFKQHQDSFGDVTKHSLDHAFLPVDPWLPVAATSHQDLPASRMSPVSSTSADHSDADSVDYSSYQFAGPQIPTPEYQLDDTIEPSIEYMLPVQQYTGENLIAMYLSNMSPPTYID
ncbi:uncharacterized protein LOC125232744 [Leguminivora glycinivorella]|uniref:uncharacterized protein LOC125232744 n=1 Tax=Leguminivora glycinivorella TaxID=1035111 RepID=UPI00200FFED1|nr:uncharacterized protein LOC125232744 [Leguminivora glycinivorella]